MARLGVRLGFRSRRAKVDREEPRQIEWRSPRALLVQLVGAPTAGLVLDAVRTVEPCSPALGYSALFAAAALSFGIASFVLRASRNDGAH
jgi:hypothetical protein